MVAAELMGSVYWQLLEQLEKKKFRVFDQPIRLSKRYKLRYFNFGCALDPFQFRRSDSELWHAMIPSAA